MAAERETLVVTVGGKGSSLSSASVFSVAHGLALLRIDSSAIPTSSSNDKSPSSSMLPISFPTYLTSEEHKAYQILLLNKLLLSPFSSSGAIVATLASNLLNSLSLGDINANGSDCGLANEDHLLAAVSGISALLDYHSSAISTVADAVAALSCEALRADVSAAFNLMDSGDGSISKEEVAVAADLKVFLNGSKLVGKNPLEAIFYIPKRHGNLRKDSAFLHSAVRVELNSGYKKTAGTGDSGCNGTGEDLANALLPLAFSLRHLGGNSRCRAKLNVESIGDDALRSRLMDIFERNCPGIDALKHLYSSASEAVREEDFVKFSHEVWNLSKTVWKIVSLEAMAALVSLEGSDLLLEIRNDMPLESDVSGDKGKPDKRSEKRKKILGKGSALLMQLFKSRLTMKPVDNLALLEKWANEFLCFLDPKDQGFDSLLKDVKDIVESNESRRLPKLAKGTRDFAKEQMAVREKAFSIIVGVFKRHGAMALDTPVFELRETLMGKYGEDSKLIYDLADQGGELCSLRYDLTVPFARYVAMNGLTSFKRYQIAKVYRRDNPSKGRYREFYQCDFDIAGQYEAMGPDFEVIEILTELLDDLNIGDYEVKLNHRKLLDGMLEICGVPCEKFRTICSSIDKLDKQSFDQIKKEMVEEKGLSSSTADKIGTFVKRRGNPLELLSSLKQEGSEFLDNTASVHALNDLEILFKALEKARCVDKIVFDLSLARGLDYYTGVIFEAVFKGATQVGSIAAGGRYDNLIGMFGTKQVPAVGVSLGIERVFTIMEQNQKNKKQAVRPTETEVLVSILVDDLSLGAELAAELWRANIKAEYMINKRVRKHIDRALDSGIPFMVLVGDDELSKGVVKLKDVAAAKEQVVPREMLLEELQRRLNSNISA